MSMISDTGPEQDQPARMGWFERALRLVFRRTPLSNARMALLWRLVQEPFPRHAKGYGIAAGAMIVMAAMTSLMAWILRDVTDQFVIDKDPNRIIYIALFIATIF